MSRTDNVQYYIDKGYIDVSDNAAFRKSYYVCNMFGHNYKGWMKGACKHKYKHDVDLWFPKFYDGDDWLNKMIGTEIFESNRNATKNSQAVQDWLDGRKIRYVFAHVEDELGQKAYRFMGEFKLNEYKTRALQRAVWERVSTRVKTIKSH